MMNPDRLDEVWIWIDQIATARDEHAPQAEIWLGETGNAQCGGAPGESDRFVAGFWWLDELGLMARAGQQVVVRQTLSGSDYGIIDEATLSPNPDYWNSLLWRRLMGPRVLDVTVDDSDRLLRAYAHCTQDPESPGSVTLLLLNLDSEQSVSVVLDNVQAASYDAYLATTPDLYSRNVVLNGTLLEVDDSGAPPTFSAEHITMPSTKVDVFLPPVSYAFVVLDIDASACR